MAMCVDVVGCGIQGCVTKGLMYPDSLGQFYCNMLYFYCNTVYGPLILSN